MGMKRRFASGFVQNAILNKKSDREIKRTGKRERESVKNSRSFK